MNVSKNVCLNFMPRHHHALHLHRGLFMLQLQADRRHETPLDRTILKHVFAFLSQRPKYLTFYSHLSTALRSSGATISNIRCKQPYVITNNILACL